MKQELRKCLIFRLGARLPTALILGFFGFRHEVMRIMQLLSHGTRAYIVNASGLPAFLIHMPDIV